jgi:small nuclear ribonucleoprotein (snRNP)-like protein
MIELDINSALSGRVEIHLKSGRVFVGEVVCCDAEHVSLVDTWTFPVVIARAEIAAVRILNDLNSKEQQK